MGIFRGLKDMKSMMEAAPGLLDQTQQMAVNATAQAAAQPAFPGATAGGLAPGDPALAPIDGIDLALYTRISKAIGQHGLTTADALNTYLGNVGTTPEAWSAANTGWVARMGANAAVSLQYSQLYATAQA